VPRRNAPAAPSGPILPALLVVAAVLALAADDRHAGKVSDGRQTIGTAVAIVETGGIGLAKGAPRAFERERDAVSRYGIGTSLAQLPAAFLAPRVEKALGPGTSQPLFLLAPFFGVLLAAAAAGLAARAAGAPDPGPALAVLLVGLGSPLAPYATSDFSEALQAAALGGALALALGSAKEGDPGRSGRRAAASGLAAGIALLLKSSLAAVAPFLLLPLLVPDRSRTRRLLFALGGAALPVAAWLAFEVARFGRPFGGYAGEGFTHPLADGLWRLLVGPNRGLLLFFPAALLAAAGLARALGRGAGAVRLAALGSLAALAALLGTAATWWAWHGAGGWGPRLLVPAVPLLAPWAALVAARFGAPARRAVAGLSILLNLPPLLVHPSLVDTYVANCRRGPLTPALERELPALAVEPDAAGRPSVPPDQALATVPSAAPHAVFPWYLAASASESPARVAERLATPPWYASRPDLGPRLVPIPVELVAVLAPPPRLGCLGRSFRRGLEDPASGSVYLASLADQVRRAQETDRDGRGLPLAEKLAGLRKDEESDALLLESLRLLGRTEVIRQVVEGLPDARATSPPVVAVLALLARDRGDLERAARLGTAAAPHFPGSLLAREPSRPAAWPETAAALLRSAPPAPGGDAGTNAR